jgi:hypothetical protein
MSTKGTLAYGRDFHLYTDWADEFGAAHAYLRIDNGLVKRISIATFPRGLSVTVRLPPQVFSILRADIVKGLQARNSPISAKQFERNMARLGRLLRGSQRRGPSQRLQKKAPRLRTRSAVKTNPVPPSTPPGPAPHRISRE